MKKEEKVCRSFEGGGLPIGTRKNRKGKKEENEQRVRINELKT
jgi:hypothetical protein